MKLGIKIVGFILIPAESTSPILEWNVGTCEELQSIERASSWIERLKDLYAPGELIGTFGKIVKVEPPADNEECEFAYVTLIETFANWFLSNHQYDRANVLAIQSSVSADEEGYCTKFKMTMHEHWSNHAVQPLYNFHRWILCPQVYLEYAMPAGRLATVDHSTFMAVSVLQAFLSSGMGAIGLSV